MLLLVVIVMRVMMTHTRVIAVILLCITSRESGMSDLIPYMQIVEKIKSN